MADSADVTEVAASTTTVELLAQGVYEEIIVVNDGTATLYVRYGSEDASSGDYSVRLGAGDSLIEDKYHGAMQGIWDAANGHARVTVVL